MRWVMAAAVCALWSTVSAHTPDELDEDAPEWKRCRPHLGAIASIEIERLTKQLQECWKPCTQSDGARRGMEAKIEGLEATIQALKEERDSLYEAHNKLQDDLASKVPKEDQLMARRLALEEKRIEAREDAASRRACAASKACFDLGKCDFIRNEGCVATKDSHCRNSKACSRFGLCAAVHKPDMIGCVAVRDRDCKRSAACRLHGQCTLNKDALECY